MFPSDPYIEDCLVSSELYGKIVGCLYNDPTDLVAMLPHRIEDIAKNVVRDDEARKTFVFNLRCRTVQFSLACGHVDKLQKLSTAFPASAFFEENYTYPISADTRAKYRALVAIVRKLANSELIVESEWLNAKEEANLTTNAIVRNSTIFQRPTTAQVQVAANLNKTSMELVLKKGFVSN